MYVSVLCMCASAHRGQKRAIYSPGAGGADSCEPPAMSTGKKLIEDQTFSF